MIDGEKGRLLGKVVYQAALFVAAVFAAVMVPVAMWSAAKMMHMGSPTSTSWIGGDTSATSDGYPIPAMRPSPSQLTISE